MFPVSTPTLDPTADLRERMARALKVQTCLTYLAADCGRDGDAWARLIAALPSAPEAWWLELEKRATVHHLSPTSRRALTKAARRMAALYQGSTA